MLGWIDLETTGLSPREDVILEIAVLITNDDLKIVDELELVLNANPTMRENADPFVQEMHDRSGLWDLCYKSDLKEAQADQQVAEFLATYLHQKSPLCGSSVHFDRNFMEVSFPVSVGLFGYRNIDVSTIKETVKLFRPEMILPSPEVKPHRALEDIEASLNEYRYYVREFFKDDESD